MKPTLRWGRHRLSLPKSLKSVAESFAMEVSRPSPGILSILFRLFGGYMEAHGFDLPAETP
ncbi:hypothetical protein [Geothrix fuzhouensis]|uniref:hypothetical protein n=1 Tax=Geothrix fuzhouensis TaxID=2966451 RepID=UPI002147E856|nr:hypothetical protein [Geothrix fuzhouensis]